MFLADTGTSNGDISGQSRPVNTCDFKQSRPFRVITGSEDNTTAVYEGPPFKFKTTKTVRAYRLPKNYHKIFPNIIFYEICNNLIFVITSRNIQDMYNP